MKITMNKKVIIIILTVVIVLAIMVTWLFLRAKNNKEKAENIATQSTTSTSSTQGLPTAPSTLSSTTETLPGNAMPEVFKDNPTEGEKLLQLSLPVMTKYFYMQYNKDTKRYLITLYINPYDESLGTVDEQLAFTKEQAKAWIRDSGVDPDKLPIDYTDAR